MTCLVPYYEKLSVFCRWDELASLLLECMFAKYIYFEKICRLSLATRLKKKNLISLKGTVSIARYYTTASLHCNKRMDRLPSVAPDVIFGPIRPGNFAMGVHMERGWSNGCRCDVKWRCCRGSRCWSLLFS
jgi:hypothetical protein